MIDAKTISNALFINLLNDDSRGSSLILKIGTPSKSSKMAFRPVLAKKSGTIQVLIVFLSQLEIILCVVS